MTDSKYDRFGSFLAGLGADTLVTSFSRVERVCGCPLPASARLYPAWWSNVTRQPFMKVVLDRGWASSDLDLKRETVRFSKRSMTVSYKYDRFGSFLAKMVSGTFVIRFLEIETVCGCPLPAPARRNSAWWAGNSAHPLMRAIRKKGWTVSGLNLKRETVRFSRETSRTGGGRYYRFVGFLAGRNDGTFVISFSRIEKMCGCALPPSARRHLAWWANNRAQPFMRMVMDSGWVSSEPNLRKKTVRFSRGGGGSGRWEAP